MNNLNFLRYYEYTFYFYLYYTVVMFENDYTCNELKLHKVFKISIVLFSGYQNPMKIMCRLLSHHALTAS